VPGWPQRRDLCAQVLQQSQADFIGLQETTPGQVKFFLENLPIEEPRNYARITYQNFFHYRATYMLHPGD